MNATPPGPTDIRDAPSRIEAHSYRDLGEMGCGSLVIALRKAIIPLEPGQVLHARAADQGAQHDIPAWCHMTGHELVLGPTGDDGNHYYIRTRRTDHGEATRKHHERKD